MRRSGLPQGPALGLFEQLQSSRHAPGGNFEEAEIRFAGNRLRWTQACPCADDRLIGGTQRDANRSAGRCRVAAEIGRVAGTRGVACVRRVALSPSCVQHRLVHHRFQATAGVAAQVEVGETGNGYDAATSATAATKSHGHLFAAEEPLQLIGQRATSRGQVFGPRDLLHEVEDGRRRACFPGRCMRRVETHAGSMLGT